MSEARPVSLDFLSSQVGRVLNELREIRVRGDVDRSEFRAVLDARNTEIARALGGLDAKLEMGFAAQDNRIDALEARLGEIRTVLDDIARKIGDDPEEEQ
jgi:hypothetical protein